MNRTAVCCAAILLAGCADRSPLFPPPPVPSRVRLMAPDNAVPPMTAKLAGRWEGDWMGPGGKREQVLYVERVQGSTARIVYAQSGQGGRPGWWRRRAVVEPDGVLKFDIPFNDKFTAHAEYRLRQDGKLEGEWSALGFRSHATLIKTQEPDPAEREHSSERDSDSNQSN